MNAALEQEHSLRAKLDEAEAHIGRLEQNLVAIDSELEELGARREQYEALAQACGALERLDAVGAARLFWGDEVDGGRAEERLRRSRQTVEAFEEQVNRITGARQDVIEQIAEGRGVLAILEDDWFDLQEQEEEKRNEWVIEREVARSAQRPATMPWTRGGEDDQRFRKSLAYSLAAALVLGLLLPLVDLPIPEPTEIIEVPARLVELIRQQRPTPPPVAQELPPEETEPQPEPEPEPEAEPEAEQRVADQQPAETAPPAEAPVPEAPPRPDARSSGILAFSASLSSLTANRPSARLGSDARINDTGDAAIGRPERSMVTTLAPGSSGGINLSSLSRDVGGGGGGGGPQIAGVQTTRVASAIGPGGGGDRPLAGSGAMAGRTDEEIQIVFDRYKASLYRLYNRELRQDPTLRGQMVLKLTIEPDGTVSFCELQSTDMKAPDLVQQVLERVRTFDFGAKDVAAITIVYPIDFLPAV